MPLVKKTSSQVLPMASRHSSVVMWLGDEALIVFKQTFLWLVVIKIGAVYFFWLHVSIETS